MNEEYIGHALIELADLANCAAGDFHCLHLNIRGEDFDTMHAQVLKTYYEEAAEDYDSLAEYARVWSDSVPNMNESAERIDYQSCDGAVCDRQSAVERTDEVLSTLIDKYNLVFTILNKLEDARCVGAANMLQTRIEFWVKEKYFFNQSRKGV